MSVTCILRTGSHRVPSSKSQKVYMWSQVLSPKYDMDAYMATLFGGVVLRIGSSKKLDSTYNTSPMIFCVEKNQDLTLMINNHVLMAS
jgi:hypothetical protein